MNNRRSTKRFNRLRNLGKRLAIWIIPPLYNSYMWFVYHTSKEVYSDLPRIWDAVARGESVLGAVWHQDAVLGRLLDGVTMSSQW